MHDIFVILVHLIVTVVRPIKPGGLRAVVAESALTRHQILILNRSRKRAPNLRVSDRIIAGLCTLLRHPSRMLRCSIVLKPSTLLHFHHVLTKRKYLQVDYVDLYLMHTPFAFRPGDIQDPRDPDGNVIYDKGVGLMDTWSAMENLVDRGKCKAIGLSDVVLDHVQEVFRSARIKPAAVQVEAHPYFPQTEILEFCNSNGLVVEAFAPLGHGIKPGVLQDPTITEVAQRVNRTAAQVLLAWALQRGTAVLTTPKTPSRARENFDISELPADAMQAINAIQTRQRFNPVTSTGVGGFVAR
jgi:diketogulonate reductase-like aldo/keto reductase